jgi:short-subunit dehydrogenase
VATLWALVTGASVGLGREFAAQLAAAGYSVCLVARDHDALAEVANDISRSHGVGTEVMSADLLVASDRQRVLERLSASDNPIDVLVSNAGWGVTGGLNETTWSVEKDHLDIHVGIPLELVHRVLPGMVERGRGRVIVLSSVAAFLSRGTYSAAKRYWVTLAQSLTVSLRTHNVSVTAVCPGLTRTEFHQRMGMDISGFPPVAWLSAQRVVSTGLRHSFRGKAVSIPSLRYRLLVLISPLIPARFHG